MRLAREIAEMVMPENDGEYRITIVQRAYDEERAKLAAAIAAKLEPVREACQKMVVYASGPHHYEEIGDADKMYAEAVAAIRSALATLSEEE